MSSLSNLGEKDASFVWHPFTQAAVEGSPVVIKKAEGVFLYDENDRRYIDANSSWWVNIHGHGNTFIADAIYEQCKTLDHIIFAGFTHPKAIELSERLLKWMPTQMQKVFFSDDGSTAVEVALKMAFQFWDNQQNSRKRILALEGAYHGDTFGAMSVGQRGYFNKPFEHFFFDVDFLEFPTTDNQHMLLKQAEKLFQTHEFAAIILEPLVQGSAGMRMYGVDFLEQITNLAKKYHVLVILDEIMTGWGRTGKMFAFDHGAIHSDIICLSKGLTGGVLPLGLTVATQEIFDAFLSEDKTKALLHGHSFTGNALACAAACANLTLFENPEVFENIARIQQQHTQFKASLTYKRVKEVRMMGTILAIELTDSKEDYFSTLRDEAYHFFLENGILLRPLGNVIFINPPYVIDNENLIYIYENIRNFISNLK